MRHTNIAAVLWGLLSLSCGASNLCVGSGDCPDESPICSSASGGFLQCAKCTTNQDCVEARGNGTDGLQSQPFCEVETGKCRYCLPSAGSSAAQGCPGSGDSADQTVCAPKDNSSDFACMSKAQVECTGDADCGVATGAKPFCVSSHCVACDGSGLSAAQTCGSRTGGMAPVCKGSVCAPCSTDSKTECPETGLCVKANDPVRGSLMVGQCVSNSDVAVVNNSTELIAALAAPAATRKAFIKVMPGTGYTAAVTVTSDTVIFGGASGRDDTAWGALTANDKGPINLSVTSGAKLVLRSLVVRGPSTSTAAAVSCSGGSQLFVVESRIRSARRGIDAESGCALLHVEKSWLSASRNAIRVGVAGNAATYRIFNNAIVESGGVMDPDAVLLGPVATGYFGYNTLKDNANGVTCDSTVKQAISESVVAGSLGMAVTNCTEGAGVIKTLISITDLGPVTDPKLVDNSTTQACCINRGVQPSGQNPMIRDDFYSTARTTAPDRGFHEVR